MADNDQANETEVAAQNPEEQASPNFALQRIYLKDASYESPGSPQTFKGQWNPNITFDIKSRNTKIQDDVYEVTLVLTVEAKLEENVAFLVEVQQGAIFTCRSLDDQQLELVLATVCPNIMFPYAREAVDALVVKGSFPALMLAPVNFEAMYNQIKDKHAQASASNGNGAAGAAGEAESEGPADNT